METTRWSGTLKSASNEINQRQIFERNINRKIRRQKYNLLKSNWWFQYTRWLGVLGLSSGITIEHGEVGFCFITSL
jgi:hypothetical protein